MDVSRKISHFIVFNLIFLVICAFYLLGCRNSNKFPVYKSATSQENLERDADSFCVQKKYGNALILYKEIIALDSSNGKYFYQSAYCEAQLFSLERSNWNYKKCLSLNYRTASSFFNLALNYALMDSPQQANYYAQKCIDIAPNRADGLRKILDRMKK